MTAYKTGPGMKLATHLCGHRAPFFRRTWRDPGWQSLGLGGPSCFVASLLAFETILVLGRLATSLLFGGEAVCLGGIRGWPSNVAGDQDLVGSRDNQTKQHSVFIALTPPASGILRGIGGRCGARA